MSRLRFPLRFSGLGLALHAADPEVHTFSIVAFDPATGELEWRWRASISAWAAWCRGRRRGRAVATQARARVSFGPDGFEPDGGRQIAAGSAGFTPGCRSRCGMTGRSRSLTPRGAPQRIPAAGARLMPGIAKGRITARKAISSPARACSRPWPKPSKPRAKRGYRARRLAAGGASKPGQAAAAIRRGQQSAALLVVSRCRRPGRRQRPLHRPARGGSSGSHRGTRPVARPAPRGSTALLAARGSSDGFQRGERNWTFAPPPPKGYLPPFSHRRD